MRDIEHRMQCACVKWFRLRYPDVVLFAIPNGGARSAVTGRRMKDEGVLAGAADLFLSHPAKGLHGMYIEMKREDGSLQRSQKAFGDRVRSAGYAYEVCRSFDDFKEVATNYLEA